MSGAPAPGAPRSAVPSARTGGTTEWRAPDRKEDQVRRMLADVGAPPVPVDLADRAMARGRRLLGRRRTRHALLWLLLAAAVVAGVVLAVALRPQPQPIGVTPPLRPW